jgi:DNA-binding HxlR family transcriptional regulator
MHNGTAGSAADELIASERPRNRVRPGSRALSIFAYALNAKTLRAHAERPLRSSDLEQMIGWAPQTSLRAAVGNLCELEVLAKREPPGATKGVLTELTPAGRDLLAVADRLERWLARAPAGAIALDSAAAAGAIRALTASWDSRVVRVLAERSLTLTQLNAEIAEISYPALERRLARLRSTNLIVPIAGSGKGKPYEVSDWLRHSIAPLSAAARWECRHIPGKVEPISHTEVEAAFLLTLPLVKFSSESTGACALAVLTSPAPDGEEEREVAGITLGVRGGEVVSCVSTADSNPKTWALGTSDDWLDAVIDGSFEVLRVRGERPQLPLHIVREFHGVLFPA